MPTTPTDTSSARRGLVRRIVIATLLGATVFAALSLYGDVRELQANLRSFAVKAFFGSLALAVGNYIVRFARWQYYLRHIGIRVPGGESSAVFLAGFVMSVTPGKVGEVFKSLLLYESRRISVAKTAPVVVAERLTDLIALVLLTAVGSLAFKQGWPLAAVGGVGVALLVFACAYRPLGDFFLGLAGRLGPTRRIADKLREAYESLFEMTRPGPLVVGTATATVAWGMECLALGVILRGFGGEALSWTATTFAYAASTIAGAVAMMPGGLGVTEVGMAGLLQLLGGENMTMALATAATILVRIATLWFAVLIGLGALGIWQVLPKQNVSSSL